MASGYDATDGTRNRILARLSKQEFQRLAPHLEDVELTFKQVVHEQGESVDCLYFMEHGVVSLVIVFENNENVEAGTVGNEGVVGVSGFLQSDAATSRAICQIAGSAKRLDLEVLRQEEPASNLSRLLFRYTNALIGMLAQTAACNRAHSLEERMCRWLLMTVDRVGTNEFPLTQEFLAQMLGVRRPSVNLAGAALQRAGLIRYSRGRIMVVDRQGLQAASCECYERVRREFEQALDAPAARATPSRKPSARIHGLD